MVSLHKPWVESIALNWLSPVAKVDSKTWVASIFH